MQDLRPEPRRAQPVRRSLATCWRSTTVWHGLCSQIQCLAPLWRRGERSLAESRKDSESRRAMKCEEVMLNHVHSCSETATAQQCARLMKAHNIGFVPVVDDQKRVVGVITDRDLALRLVAEGRPATDPISELMTFRDLLTCKPDEDIEVLEERMAR